MKTNENLIEKKDYFYLYHVKYDNNFQMKRNLNKHYFKTLSILTFFSHII